MINVTKPFFPPKQEFDLYIQQIWERNWITNHGPLVNELEVKLKEYLGISDLLFLSNGTIALQIAIKALELKGDVITTPFSYVATTSSIVWEGCKPVFVDIDPLTFNIDATKIESSITANTTAILATHVFGNPCDIEAIELIAKNNNIKVIYDAAHCFGVKYNGDSIFNFGDISTCSFHATKVFHSAEGGAVISNDPELMKKMAYLRNFGHQTPYEFASVGINGKNSELHAAMGLTVLPYINEILNRREVLFKYYDQVLEGQNLQKQVIQKNTTYNYSYYPILFDSEATLLKCVEFLNENLIYPRRYFFPSLDTLKYINSNICPISRDISKRILCLPLFHDLSFSDIDTIAKLLLSIIKR